MAFHSETKQRHPRELFLAPFTIRHSQFTILAQLVHVISSQAAALEYMGPGVQLVALTLRLCELHAAAGATQQASLAIPARPSPFRRHPLPWPSAFQWFASPVSLQLQVAPVWTNHHPPCNQPVVAELARFLCISPPPGGLLV